MLNGDEHTAEGNNTLEGGTVADGRQAWQRCCLAFESIEACRFMTGVTVGSGF